MHVKICGITTSDTALIAARAGATMIGFVFAPSRRQISVEKAKRIVASLPPSVEKVGVFVNASNAHIRHIAKEVGLTMIQLHGEESASLMMSLPYPVIKAFPITAVHEGMENTWDPTYFLIDSPPAQFKGGSGVSFNWDLLQQTTLPMHQSIIAGGLTPDNVHEAIIRTNCIGVDVSSGVETNGVKDHEKIEVFITRAKEAKGENQ